MTAEEKLKERHKVANEKLKEVAIPKIEKMGLKIACSKVSANVGYSYQTVVNYVYGMAKDGFLTESITQEFKLLKV